MPIPSDDLVRLRSPHHSSPHAVINVWQLTVVATARVNQATFGYPLSEITVDNQSADWSTLEVGQMYRIFNLDGDMIAAGIVRKPPSGSTFYITAVSRGDAGVAMHILSEIDDNFEIEVYNYYPLWALHSRIANGVFYKRFDIPYTDQGSSPDPVCNMGAWRHAFETGGSAEFTFSAAESFAWNSKTITGYAWAMPAGYTLISGTLTDDALTVTLPTGFHLVRCTVTDSGGKTRTGIRPVWVTTRSGTDAPFSVGRAVTVVSDQQGWDGRTIGYEISGRADLTDALFWRGAAMLHKEYAQFGGETLSAGIYTDTFAGFITEATATGTIQKTTLGVNATSPFIAARKVGISPQAIIEASSPANFTEIAEGMGHVDFAAWYVMQYECPNLLTLFDFVPVDDDQPPRRRQRATQGDTITGQIEDIMTNILGNAGSASDGTIIAARNPAMEENDYRNACDTRMTIDERDVTTKIEYAFVEKSPLASLTMYAFITGGDEVDAQGVIAPGRLASQGGSKSSAPTLTARTVLEARQKVGHAYARDAAPSAEMAFSLNRNLDVFDPARQFGAWYGLDIPSRFDPYGQGYTGRVQIKSVNRQWSVENGVPIKRISVTVVRESYGRPGELIPKEKASNLWEIDYLPPEEYDMGSSGFLIAWTGDLGRTFGMLDDIAPYEDAAGEITGEINDVALDWHSGYVTSGYQTGGLGAWAVATSGTSLRIYYSEDILASTIRWTLQKTYTMELSTVTSSARIVSDKTAAGIVWCTWRCRTRTRAVMTSDGETWDSAATVIGGYSGTDTTEDNAPIGLLIDGTRVIATSQSASGTYSIYYRSKSSNGAWTLADLPASDHPISTIAGAGDGTIFYPYVSAFGGTNPVYYYDAGASPGAYYTQATAVTPLTGTPSVDGYYTHGILGSVMGGIQPGDTAAYYPGLTAARWKFGAYPVNVTEVSGEWLIVNYNYASGFSIDFEYGWRLLDEAGSVLLTQTYTATYTRSSAGVYESETYTQNETGLTVTGAQYIEFFAQSVDEFGGGTLGGGAQEFMLGIGTFEATTAVPVGGYRYLVRASNITAASPTIRRISPADGYIPAYPYAISVESSYKRLIMISVDGSGGRRLDYSENGGTTWTNVATGISSDYRGIKRAASNALLWGAHLLDYSEDNGLTVYDVKGDWAGRIGAGDTYLGAIAIL